MWVTSLPTIESTTTQRNNANGLTTCYSAGRRRKKKVYLLTDICYMKYTSCDRNASEKRHGTIVKHTLCALSLGNCNTQNSNSLLIGSISCFIVFKNGRQTWWVINKYNKNNKNIFFFQIFPFFFNFWYLFNNWKFVWDFAVRFVVNTFNFFYGFIKDLWWLR